MFKVRNKETKEENIVYHINVKYGPPLFLIYKNNNWKMVSCFDYEPVEEDIKE